MARAIVHIGTHKTGTTAFQNWAEAHREPLKREVGLRFYRGFFATTHVEFTLLSLRMNRNMQTRARRHDWVLPSFQAELRAHIAKQLRGDDDILISDEALSYFRHADEVECLREMLQPRDVEFVVVLRDPSQYLRSYRDQLEAAGFPPSPYRESFAYVEDDTWLTDYDSLLETFDQPNVVSYEQAMAEHGSIIPPLMTEICGRMPDLPWDEAFDNVTAERSGRKDQGTASRRYLRRVLRAAARRL